MSKNPIINALSASGYILLVAAVMNFISTNLRNKPDTFFAPVVVLSTLVLSVTVMAFIFFYQPVQLFMANKKKEAINLFMQTVLAFAVFTIIAFALLFSGVL